MDRMQTPITRSINCRQREKLKYYRKARIIHISILGLILINDLLYNNNNKIIFFFSYWRWPISKYLDRAITRSINRRQWEKKLKYIYIQSKKWQHKRRFHVYIPSSPSINLLIRQRFKLNLKSKRNFSFKKSRGRRVGYSRNKGEGVWKMRTIAPFKFPSPP